MTKTITLYRPVGPIELQLIEDSEWTAFPTRLPEQPIFYPVLNPKYAQEIAERWNLPQSSAGYVTKFEINADFLKDYEVQNVGAAYHLEYWILASKLEEFNDNIVGSIKVINKFENHKKEDQ